jgi:molybdopterin converting factor small subunit
MVQIRFYGVVRSIAGRDALNLDYTGTMEGLMKEIFNLYPAIKEELGLSVVLLNHRNYEDNDPVGIEDEVIIMPALGGG